MEKERVYTIAELSEMLKITTVTVRDQISKGNIKAVRIGKSIRITEQEIKRLLGEE